MVKSFYFGSGKMIFALLIEVIASHVIINLINIRKTIFERTFTRAFYSHRSIFYYYLKNILHVLICINLFTRSGPIKAVGPILQGHKVGVGEPASLSESLRKSDGDLNKIEPVDLET